MPVLLDSEAAQQGCGIALGVPSFKFREFLFEFRGAYAVLVTEILLRI